MGAKPCVVEAAVSRGGLGVLGVLGVCGVRSHLFERSRAAILSDAMRALRSGSLTSDCTDKGGRLRGACTRDRGMAGG